MQVKCFGRRPQTQKNLKLKFYMKLKSLLLALVLIATQQAMAIDIHGVNGYYNYTAAQMKADGVTFPMFSDGQKVQGWFNPDAQFDGDYVKFVMGLNSTTLTTANVGKFATSTTQAMPWRVSFKWLPAEPVRITKNYPVVAWKFSLPENSIDSAYIDMFCEHWIVNPTTGKEETLTNRWGDKDNADKCYWDPLKGLSSNGRCSYWAKYPGLMVEDESSVLGSLKMDSCCAQTNWKATDLKLHNNGFIYDGYLNQTRNDYTGTSMEFIRLPKEAGEKAEFIVLINYYCIPDTAEDKAASNRLLDRIDYLEIPRQHFNFWCLADTLNADGSVKTDAEKPTVYMKWMKTFASIEAAEAAITAANNWGDGAESTEYTALTYQLYYAEQMLKGYQWRNEDPENPTDEPWIALKAAYDEANAVYTASTSDDAAYSAANDVLSAARTAFYEAVDLDKSLVYNYMSTISGNIIVGSEVSVGGLTGKALSLGSSEAKVAFSFAATGNVQNGQKTYRLKTTDGVVAQASDGTLVLVTDGSVEGSVFTFSDRDGGGNYDMKCGDYYYYLADGMLACTKTIDESVYSDYDALTAYFFSMTDALDDYKATASTDGLFAGWEFNSTPEADPSIVGDNEQGSKMIDHWRKSRWRMQSQTTQETVKGADGSDATCICLTSTPVYDAFDGSESFTNDYSTPAAMRYDSGTEDPVYARDPSPRDSTLAYTIDAGATRYFAIKMKGTDDVEFGTLTFLNLGTQSVTISADQMTGQKGDVLYWDMLNSGFGVGRVLFTSAFFSPTGFTSADSKLYVDWMRTYESIDEIPEESFSTSIFDGITTVNASSNSLQGSAIYNLDGRMIGTYGKTQVPAGVYVVKSNGEAKKVVIK